MANTRLQSAGKLKVTAVATYTYLHRLDKNNEQAQFEKAPIQETTARTLQYFIPTVILVAAVSGIIVSLFSPLHWRCKVLFPFWLQPAPARLV